jgi:DNA invertase Pin-like site-specific DNA recombinase
MAIIGYARVSSFGQSLDLQVDKLKAYGCTKIFKETISGVNQHRPELINCLNYLREDDQDTLVITKLDRMARSALHLGKIVEQLDNKGVDFVVIDQNIDTKTPIGKLMFQQLASFAEFENNLRKERQLEGIAKAKRDGKKFGRPQKINKEIVSNVLTDINQKISLGNILKKYNIGKGTYYNIKNGEYDNLIKDCYDHNSSKIA